MDDLVHPGGGHGGIGQIGQRAHALFHQVLEPGADPQKGQQEHHQHDADEHRHGGVAAREDPVDLCRADVLLALLGLVHRCGTHLADELETHLRYGSVPVQTPLGLHLGYNVEYGLFLVLVQFKAHGQIIVSLYYLVHCKEQRDACPGRVVHYKE